MQSISRTPSIYQIRHIESGKVYVGSAVNPRARWGQHRSDLSRDTHHSSRLQNAWNKYGESAFLFEILEPVLFIEDLIAREQYWIDFLHAADRAYGYNTAPIAGSALGVKQSEETRAKLSGRVFTPEERARRSERQKARWNDPVAREQMIAALNKHWDDPTSHANASARMRKRYADPAERAKSGERFNAYWSRPDAVQERSERLKKRWANAAAHQRVSETSKKYWADPSVRQQKSEDSKARLADPVERAKMSARAKALWADPDYRARQAKKRDERKERKS